MSVKTILISQAAPKVIAPYDNLSSKYGVKFVFQPFCKTVPLSSIEMRSQHCNVLDYTAIVFSARSTIDAFFTLCEDLRVKVPETMKYFCTNEKVAMYLQKHIVYRKRKIFYGDGTPSSVVALITAKHKDDNFMIVTTKESPVNSISLEFDKTEFKHSNVIFAKSVPCELKDIDPSSFDVIVMYSKLDVAGFKSNFPDFVQGDTAFITYGSDSLKKAVSEAGYSIAVSAPSPNCPSVVAAIEQFILSSSSK